MNTRCTELLGIKYPIIQPGMTYVSSPGLVSAVCKAGGLGILSVTHPDELRQAIIETKESIGDQPFGVNIIPIGPGMERKLQIMLEEKVPVWSSGLGNPFKIAGIKKPDSVIYIPTVGNARQAKSVEKAGADAIMVQGWEAGGHGATIASSVLIPEVVDAVKLPVIAAGGISDGRGLAAALAFGADGIAMGTRFAASQESPLLQELKQVFLDAIDSDALKRDVWDGLPLRAIPGGRMKNYHGWWTHFWDALPCAISEKKRQGASFKDLLEIYKFLRQTKTSPIQFAIGMNAIRITIERADLNNGILAAGQVVGRINDIPTCREIIERTNNEAEQVIKDLNGRLA
jgi:NAD(P)H-dependent flavin oxidoreductase YrpB (nitropropane dioxygenase family)